MIRFKPYFIIAAAAMIAGTTYAQDVKETQSDIEEIRVWGTSISSDSSGYTSPTSVLLAGDMLSINAASTEDLVKFEPSLVVRRRFIGDSNGTLGIRGSNMFQTSRSMVFSDGVPLHYLLQSRWNGAPRWTMVSASEIAKVEVLYGPFSAEYSGNSMGGTVLIETGIPQQQEFHADIKGFGQQFDAYGFDDTLKGYKGFMSYGNKVGDLSYYLSFNRLDNESQPQTFRGASREDNADAGVAVNGGIEGVDSRNREQLWYGDTGVVETVTSNYKMKLGYDFGNWTSLLNVAFEDRASENTGNSYMTDENGDVIWSADNLIDGDYDFSFDSSGLNNNQRDRESLSLGLRLRGDIFEQTALELNVNQFDILNDESRESALNPNDPAFTSAGQIEEYDSSGWQTAELKFTTQNAFAERVELVTGLRYEHYELNLNQYDSADYARGERGVVTSRFGGKTEIMAAFAQANWGLTDRLDLVLGVRYEEFESSDGYYSEGSGDDLDLIFVPEVSDTSISPKFSLGYTFNNQWLVRYSAAKAARFPIVEELFRQYESYNSINESNPELEPEDGLHQNFMIERSLDDGYLRVNVFHETIKDAIESQSTTTDSGETVNTFVPLDETRASGIEFVINQKSVALDNLDLRFNVTYTDAEIVQNDANPEWEGNEYPRMPKWRSNLLATYYLSDQWNAGVNIQYASDSYGRLQNDDMVDEVYGAQDAYMRIGLKTNYAFSGNLSGSFGVDNLTNQTAYVAHPWPGRTFYLGVAYDL